VDMQGQETQKDWCCSSPYRSFILSVGGSYFAYSLSNDAEPLRHSAKLTTNIGPSLEFENFIILRSDFL